MFPGQLIQASFAGFGAFGADSQVALRNSVVDVSLEINFANRVVAYTSNLTQQLVSRLNSSGFKVLNIDDSNLNSVTGGTIRVRVEVLTDGYASARDAASVVAGAASYLGYNVVGFVGIVAGTVVSSGAAGQTNTGQVFGPGTVPDPDADKNKKNALEDFIDSLTKSPTTLAVIAGAAVLLIIAVKGK